MEGERGKEGGRKAGGRRRRKEGKENLAEKPPAVRGSSLARRGESFIKLFPLCLHILGVTFQLSNFGLERTL